MGPPRSEGTSFRGIDWRRLGVIGALAICAVSTISLMRLSDGPADPPRPTERSEISRLDVVLTRRVGSDMLRLSASAHDGMLCTSLQIGDTPRSESRGSCHALAGVPGENEACSQILVGYTTDLISSSRGPTSLWIWGAVPRVVESLVIRYREREPTQTVELFDDPRYPFARFYLTEKLPRSGVAIARDRQGVEIGREGLPDSAVQGPTGRVCPEA